LVASGGLQKNFEKEKEERKQEKRFFVLGN
jgi:hypothetical protein